MIQVSTLASDGSPANSQAALEQIKTPSGRLSKLLKDSILYQYHVAKQMKSTATMKFDPVTQISEVSLLKDIVNSETLTKF